MFGFVTAATAGTGWWLTMVLKKHSLTKLVLVLISSLGTTTGLL